MAFFCIEFGGEKQAKRGSICACGQIRHDTIRICDAIRTDIKKRIYDQRWGFLYFSARLALYASVNHMDTSAYACLILPEASAENTDLRGWTPERLRNPAIDGKFLHVRPRSDSENTHFSGPDTRALDETSKAWMKPESSHRAVEREFTKDSR